MAFWRSFNPMIKKQKVKAALPAAARRMAEGAATDKTALIKPAASNHDAGFSQWFRDGVFWWSSLQAITLAPNGNHNALQSRRKG